LLTLRIKFLFPLLILVTRCFIILLCFLFTGWKFYSNAQQINIWKYNIEDGLVNNDILNIYQDSRGFIWLCTRGGLSRYDGSRFTNFTPGNGLATDMINDIYEVKPQQFLVAQNAGGPAWLINDRIRPITGNNSVTINRFYNIQNRLVGTTDGHGIVEWNKSIFRQADTAYKESISSMTAINDSAWVLIHLPYSLTYSTAFLKSWGSPLSTNATAIFTDSRHRTWIGTEHGLKLVNIKNLPEKLAFLSLPAPYNISLLNEAYIDCMMEDSQGNTWIGTVNGLVRVDKNERTTIYTQENGLPASQINCIKEDREKNIWIGTPLGLAKISLTNNLNTFQLDLGPSHDGTLGILPVSENNWRVFDGKNTRRLDAATFKLSNTQSVNTSSYKIFQLNNEEFLIANNGTATVYRLGRESTQLVTWPSEPARNVIRKDSICFLGTYADSILAIQNGRIIEKFKTGSKSQLNRLLIDKNNYLWASTWNNGLYKIKISQNNGIIRFQIIDTINASLPDANIRTIYAYKKNELWIGTRYKGIVRLLELPNGKYEIQNYGTPQGLSSDFVLTINSDHYGNIWVGSVQGIDKLIPEGKSYRIFNFGRANKYFSKVFDIKFLSNNNLIATGYPSLLYSRDLQQDTLSPPDVYITKASPGPSDTSFTTGSVLRLPTNKAQIYFEFSAPQYINEDFGKYSYRLLGNGDTSWKLSGKSRNVYFASLKPGAYSFEIRALGFNDQWGIPASYNFIVNTPFWQKAWFIALMIVITGLLAYAIYRYRVRQLIHVQKVRNRIASDLHDEIGSNLTNINILSTLSKRNLAQPQKAGDFLNRISDEVSSSSQALDDIIWSVNTSHDTLEETVARMRRYAAELFDAANISYELYLDPVFEARKIGMEQRRDLYLLYKEAVNNISKHASAKQVAIQLAIERNHLMLVVKDDGKGFDQLKGTERHGLEGIKERVKKWKGRINLESKPGKGTLIQVWLPLG
jgi:ligand-binding sensor domain-containing protein/two-component sensor histidine kinase